MLPDRSSAGPDRPNGSGFAAHRTADVLAQPVSRSGSRLIVLPAAPVVTMAARPSVFEDLLELSTHRLSAFLAEAAVLVLVLGLLERFLAIHRVEAGWVAGTLGISAALLAGSVAVELMGRRRSGAS